MKWESESSLALQAVSTSEELILDRPEQVSVRRKETARDLVTAVDMQIEKHIKSILQSSSLPIVAEESFSEAQAGALRSPVYWAVDAIDGTTNFVAGMPNFGVSVGLVVDQQFEVGAVSLPAFKELYFTHGKKTAYVNGRLLRVPDSNFESALIAMSFASRASDSRIKGQYEFFGFLNENSRGCLRTGSAAYNLCYAASGKLQAALGFGAHVWDVAAGLAIARASGAMVRVYWLAGTSRCHYLAGAPSVVARLEMELQSRQMVSFREES